ncbi:hypothetical protein AVEN_48057-1 [Araneus ventricosus]|uniref:DNA-directed DNA polymerase n=1 Tax=Araneus ventricosus TaxID=182803 RepID=A0A4Y2QRT8_ARAVE|nr:hypothetical protein AVEN_48057-1 [Araneus ventricosus]
MDNFEKFSETDLPPKDKFYSRLNEQNITDADYEHEQNVCRKFCIKNMGEYTDLYVKSDVHLSADIFENFRDLCMNTYTLDPAWYFTPPGLSWAPEMRNPSNCREMRLLTTLYDKEKYIIHYRNLKQYVQLGMKISKIHRILQFEQTHFLKPYIDLNASLCQKAKTEFQKNFFKLMNNSIFRKTMENTRRRANIRICCNEKKDKKLTAQSNFVDRTLFSENLAAFEMPKTISTLNKLITIGTAILDVSKILMYDFH